MPVGKNCRPYGGAAVMKVYSQLSPVGQPYMNI